jgi:hypothetical protein
LVYLEALKLQAIEKGFIDPKKDIDASIAFFLVRDMPYMRASNREPLTTIREWQGTCSGKHMLLKVLFAELGIRSQLIACTTEDYIDPTESFGKLRKILEETNGRIVDIHNFLILSLPDSEMVVDATWPMSMKRFGLIVNETFILGEDHVIAGKPIKKWIVPDGCDAVEFKNKLLQENFTPQELDHRERFLSTFSQMINSRGIRWFYQIKDWLNR